MPPLKQSTLDRRARKQRAATSCWRCDALLEEHAFGNAVLEVEYADGSYSGRFVVPLCTGCLTAPHQDGLQRV